MLSGAPHASGLVVWRSDDGRRAVAIYRCTPGSFRWRQTADETIAVIEGRATVKPDRSQAFELRPGDIARLPSGIDAEWNVHDTLLDIVNLHSEGGLDL